MGTDLSVNTNAKFVLNLHCRILSAYLGCPQNFAAETQFQPCRCVKERKQTYSGRCNLLETYFIA